MRKSDTTENEFEHASRIVSITLNDLLHFHQNFHALRHIILAAERGRDTHTSNLISLYDWPPSILKQKNLMERKISRFNAFYNRVLQELT